MLTAPPALGAGILALEQLVVVDVAMHDRLLGGIARLYRRLMPPTRMRLEIAEQPAAVADTLEALAEPALALAHVVRERSIDRIVLIARGSSDHAAVYGRYLLEGRCGLVTALAAPSLYTTYAAPVDLRGALAIGVSQSGETPEIVSALAYAAERGALTAGITNAAGSSLARSVDASARHACGRGALGRGHQDLHRAAGRVRGARGSARRERAGRRPRRDAPT